MTNKFYVKMLVEFQGEIEADSLEEAESKSWTSWSDEAGAEIEYAGVYSIDVEDLGEICEDCNEGSEQCDCEEEDLE